MLEAIVKQFEAIGARLLIHSRLPNRSVRDYDLNIRRDRHGEHFSLGVRHPLPDFRLLQADRATKHLLLMAAKDRLLCGHDERHWFVASVDRPVSTVMDARRALLPTELRDVPIPPRTLVRRHNAIFLRQGEWFFVPTDRDMSGYPILRNEPLVRNRMSKAHMVSEVIRFGGQRVFLYMNREFTPGEWEEYRQKHPSARGRDLVKNPEIYARGEVRHPDHATLVLKGWHRVYPNREATSINVSFYD